MTARLRRARAEIGSATVIVLVLFGLLSVISLCGAGLGGLLVGQRKVSAAADLAALAGAAAFQQGRAPCPSAAAVAAANKAVLTGCQQDGETVMVRVTVAVRSPFGGAVRLTASARAGPQAKVVEARLSKAGGEPSSHHLRPPRRSYAGQADGGQAGGQADAGQPDRRTGGHRVATNHR